MKLLRLFRELNEISNGAMQNPTLRLIGLAVITTALEALSLATIFPVIESILSPNAVPYVIALASEILGIDNQQTLIAALALVATAFIARAYLSSLFFLKLADNTSKMLSITSRKLMKNFLEMSFIDSRNFSLSKGIRITATSSNIIAQLGYFNAVLFIADILILTSLLGILLFLAPIVTLSFIVVVLAFGYCFGSRISKYLSDLGDKRKTAENEKINVAKDAFNSLIELDIYNLKNTALSNFDVHNQVLSNTWRKFNLTRTMPKALLEPALGAVGILGILVLLTFDLLDAKTLSALFVSLLVIMKMSIYLLRLNASLSTLLFIAPTLTEAYEYCLIHDEQEPQSFTPPSLTDLSFEGISIQNLSFAYGEETIFEDISVEINKTDKIALVGQSGSGKTTLLNIILGLLVPTIGHVDIKYKSPNGNITRTNLRHLRQQNLVTQLFALIPQKPYLFSGTISDNIMFDDKDDTRLEELLELLEFKDDKNINFIGNESVGENGSLLSGGQAQRVGIGRGLYRRADILLMDEPTSSLDQNRSKRIIRKILQENKEKTVILITHDPTLTKGFDKVFEVKNQSIYLQDTAKNR